VGWPAAKLPFHQAIDARSRHIFRESATIADAYQHVFAALWESRQTLGKLKTPRDTWRDVPEKRGVAPYRVHPQ
jgi:hypothetical protein